jgi:hypothetical protein
MTIRAVPELAAMGTEAYVRQLRQKWSPRQALVDSHSDVEDTAAR